MDKLRVAIIGAGPCGLGQLLVFKQAELVCFERQSDWGGLWLYTSRIGVDVHGEPIHFSMYRDSSQPPPDSQWPPEITNAAMPVRMDGRTAHCKDGSTRDQIDAMIFCTGYRHSDSFMAKELRLEAGLTELVPKNLYKSIFWNDQPRLAYLGAPRQLLSFPMFDGQAALIRDVFLGRIQLPDKHQRHADIDKWRQREQSLASDDFLGMIDLLQTSEQSPSAIRFDFSRHNQMYKDLLQSKLNDLIHYQDKYYESIFNTKSKRVTEVHKAWIENKDDSMSSFLAIYQKK